MMWCSPVVGTCSQYIFRMHHLTTKLQLAHHVCAIQIGHTTGLKQQSRRLKREEARPYFSTLARRRITQISLVYKQTTIFKVTP